MTQSKKIDDTFTIDIGNLKLDDIIDTTGDIVIDLNNMYSSTHWVGDGANNVVYSGSNDGTFTLSGSETISIGDYNTDIHTDWIYNTNNIDPNEVERMCKQYPALEKVWRNFKSVYDMVQQDYKGKKEAGEIDDDIPF